MIKSESRWDGGHGLSSSDCFAVVYSVVPGIWEEGERARERTVTFDMEGPPAEPAEEGIQLLSKDCYFVVTG